MANAIAKFWVMPRTGTALSPVDSTSAGVTATKGFNLAADLIGGLPELEDQIGGTMVGTSGQARSEHVSTAVDDVTLDPPGPCSGAIAHEKHPPAKGAISALR